MTFIFKRQFFIPFFIVWLGYISYFIWQLNKYYSTDFSNKRLPATIKYEWFFVQVMGQSFLHTFLLAFFVGSCCYSHYSYKKRKDKFRPFARINVVVLMIVAASCFVYAGFVESGYQRKSLRILSDVIYSRTADEYYSGKNRTNELYLSPELNNLPELIRLRRQAKKSEVTQDNSSPDYLAPWSTKVRRLDFAISVTILIPFILLLYYAVAVFTGILLRRVHFVVSILIAGLLFFCTYNWLQPWLDHLYYKEKISLQTRSLSVPLILLLLSVLGYLYCNKRKLLTAESKKPVFQFEEETTPL